MTTPNREECLKASISAMDSGNTTEALIYALLALAANGVALEAEESPSVEPEDIESEYPVPEYIAPEDLEPEPMEPERPLARTSGGWAPYKYPVATEGPESFAGAVVLAAKKRSVAFEIPNVAKATMYPDDYRIYLAGQRVPVFRASAQGIQLGVRYLQTDVPHMAHIVEALEKAFPHADRFEYGWKRGSAETQLICMGIHSHGPGDPNRF